MSRKYAHLVGFALDHPWAVTPGMLRVVAGILGDRLAGKDADPAVVQMAVAARKSDLPQPARGGVAVIPMYGVLAPRANMLTEASGGTSYERLSMQLREVMARDDVKTVVFDVDSPGGSAAGATEFAAELRAARARKPIVAVANHQMASGAYWVMANATKIHASPSAMVGSIGVYSMHNDLTDALAKLGVKRTYISAGKHKLDGIDGAPLSEDALAYVTTMVAQTYDRFIADVAKGRGVAATSVRGGFGEGRVLQAEDALAAGMIDKIATLDETIERLLPAGGNPVDAAALRGLADTSQEPSPATDQDQRAHAHTQRHALERALLELQLSL